LNDRLNPQPKAISAALLVFEWLRSKTGSEWVPMLRKTYSAGHGLPFVKARIPVDIATRWMVFFPLFTTGYGILSSNMGC
jgi:hypothetical protein